MDSYCFTDAPLHDRLTDCAKQMNLPENHLGHLLNQDNRFAKYSLSGSGIFYDFSRQRIDATALDLLVQLSKSAGVLKKFQSMASGEKVNVTENRAALHTAARQFSDEPVFVSGHDVIPELEAVRTQVKEFALNLHQGKIKGGTGKPIRHIVVVGIGGSYLGTEFVSTALARYADKGIDIHFLANVDINNFGALRSQIDPEEALWIVISKSYTTAETLANETVVREYLAGLGIDASKHIVTITAKGSPGDTASNPVLKSFHMFDYIGGRYSVTSAVGGVPLGLYLGYDRFERFLKGAARMDAHALTAPEEENLPLIAALISIWNTSFLGYSQQAIIPYAAPLARLASHIQQLNMESCGKSVTAEGKFLEEPAGSVIFGEPGTCAQHSFFQLAHQGKPFPIEFIGVIRPNHEDIKTTYNGVTNHQELWANMIAQANALAVGKQSKNPANAFSGNRPSSTIVLEDLSPENVGRLLSFYEAKTVFEAFIWGINPFDQFGVELGKKMASGIRKQMALKNSNPDHSDKSMDPITRSYLEMLFHKKIK